jgi:hypothetical protein
MPHHTFPHRTFTQEEARALFEKAAALQGAQQHPETPGLTLEELKRAAEAAGIDPAYLDQALTAPERPERYGKKYLGRETGAYRSRVVPYEIDDDAWGRVVRDLRSNLGGQGETEKLGGVYEWRRSPLKVTAEPVPSGGTRLTASASWEQAMSGAFLLTGLMTAFIIGMAYLMLVKGDPAEMGVVALGLMLVIVPLLYSARGYWNKGPRVGAKFDAALSRAEAILKADSHASDAAVVREAPTPLIDLDASVTHEPPTPQVQRARS